MKLVETEELETLTPPNHFKVSTKRVIGENVGAKNVRVSLAVAEKGGGANIHTHANMEHIFYVIEGQLRVKGDKEEVEVKKGMALFVAPGEAHGPYNPGPSKTVYLTINSP